MTPPPVVPDAVALTELRAMVFAMMVADASGNVVEADAAEAERRLVAYERALLTRVPAGREATDA